MGMDISVNIDGKEKAYFRKFEPLASYFAGDNCPWNYVARIQYDKAMDFCGELRLHLSGELNCLDTSGDYLYRWKYLKALALFEELLCYGEFDKGKVEIEVVC